MDLIYLRLVGAKYILHDYHFFISQILNEGRGLQNYHSTRDGKSDNEVCFCCGDNKKTCT